jgi:zinc/manganese transport system ATP-binding protein
VTGPTVPTTDDDGGRADGVVLEVDDVTVELGRRTVLDRVSFSVAAGSFTGLIGSNGAGKTTLLRAILGLVTTTAGRILLDGVDRSGRPRLNRLVGYVPQKIALEPDMPLRARDLVGLGIDGHRYGLVRPGAARRRAVDEMLEAVHATAFADARVGALSGGEQQRIMIAHALIGRPKLLLLDEPLANLDIASGQEVVDLLHGITSAHGVAVLLSAHDVNPLLPAMDHLVYLADGRAVSGTSEEVVRTEVLTDLYRHPVEVVRAAGRVLVVSGQGFDVSHGQGFDDPHGHGHDDPHAGPG